MEVFMPTPDLSNKRVAILVTDGFEQEELTSPLAALKKAGARVDIIAPEMGKVRGWKHTDWGDSFAVDEVVSAVSVEDYDALVLPGGVINPDQLRQKSEAVAFVRAFVRSGKPVASICHGPQILIEADVVRGRAMTSYPSIRTDLINAGARWQDQAAVVDQGLVTSRSPADLVEFNAAMLEEFAEGRHSAGAARG